ncbi:MAG: Rieske (2Fe-2S) protein [Anaerolineae bacterium]|nr:Rieske (2Fe-2S) protein [Anaerolineae bacterium]
MAENVDYGSEQTSIPPDGKPIEQQPRWRQDFPIDWPVDEYISRRDFVKFLMLTSAAFTTGQFWLLAQSALRSEEKLEEKAIARVEDIAVGQSVLFEYPDGSPERLLVRVEEDVFVAYEQQCTHLLCPVVPHIEERELFCPCHHGVFDMMTGRPLQGPPQRPLAKVVLEVREDVIYATGIEERTS